MSEEARFVLPGTLAGLSRGLREPGVLEHRAEQIISSVRNHPKQRLGVAVALLQVMDYLALDCPRAREVPAVVLDALAAVLGVDAHVKRTAALNRAGTEKELADQLGVSERTIRRWRKKGVNDHFAGQGALQIADACNAWAGTGFPPGAHEALFDLAATEASDGKFFSSDLLWALAEVLGIADRQRGLSQAAVEGISGGLREPDKFIAAGIAEGQDELAGRTPSINSTAKKVGVDRKSVRDDWHKDTAYALNRMAPGAFARFNRKPK